LIALNARKKRPDEFFFLTFMIWLSKVASKMSGFEESPGLSPVKPGKTLN